MTAATHPALDPGSVAFLAQEGFQGFRSVGQLWADRCEELPNVRGIYAVTFSLQSAWYLFAGVGYALSKRDVAAPILVPEEIKKAA